MVPWEKKHYHPIVIKKRPPLKSNLRPRERKQEQGVKHPLLAERVTELVKLATNCFKETLASEQLSQGYGSLQGHSLYIYHIGRATHFVVSEWQEISKWGQNLQSGWLTHLADQQMGAVPFVVSVLFDDTICWYGHAFRINILYNWPILLMDKQQMVAIQNQHSEDFDGDDDEDLATTIRAGNSKLTDNIVCHSILPMTTVRPKHNTEISKTEAGTSLCNIPMVYGLWKVPSESNVMDTCTLLFQCPPSSLFETWNIKIKLWIIMWWWWWSVITWSSSSHPPELDLLI